MLNPITVCQQGTISRRSTSMRLEGISKEISLPGTVGISTMLIPSLEGTVSGSEGSAQGQSPRVNLDLIVSQTMSRMYQVSVLFPVVPWDKSVLKIAVKQLLMASPNGICICLTETLYGLFSKFSLELTVLVLEEDGMRFLSMLVPVCTESQDWEVGSHEGKRG